MSNGQRMYPHLYLANTMVNSREAARQARARQQGVTTLAEYRAWRAA